MSNEGEFVGHTSCPDCGGSDCLATYSDGGRYCFGLCDGEGNGFKGKPTDKMEFSQKTVKKQSGTMLTNIEFTALNTRKISKEICTKYGYGLATATIGGVEAFWQVANYYDASGTVVAQKLRNADKEFKFVGDAEKGLLWGRHLWRNKGGRKVVVTEGEVDCLSVAEAFEGKYPVVSISTGANSARKCLINNLDWLESFDQIILWFDSDEAGQTALSKCTGIFSPNKLYIVPYDSQYKDANEVLVAEGRQGVTTRLYEAKEHREDNVVKGSDLSFTKMRKNIRKGRPLPYPILQYKTMGVRDGELWIWTAGSGIGKSTIVTEVGKFMLDTMDTTKLGCLYLEESTDKTYDRFMALEHNVPLKDLRLNHDLIDEEKAYDTHNKYFASDRISFYDHFGSVATDRLLEKIRYLHIGCGCDTIILDHISIAVSGLSTDEDERKMLDVFMTNLRSFVEETGCTIHAIVHLKRVSGKSFNEGASVSLSDLRGSASLEQLSDTVISAERNQQGENACVAKLRILKCRETGETGEADSIEYIRETGRYVLYEDPDNEFSNVPNDSNDRSF